MDHFNHLFDDFGDVHCFLVSRDECKKGKKIEKKNYKFSGGNGLPKTASPVLSGHP